MDKSKKVERGKKEIAKRFAQYDSYSVKSLKT